MSYNLKFTFACLPRTSRGTPVVIGGDPKGKNFLYANGNSIIMRNIHNPEISDVYTEHATQTCVAKYSPSGFYIASADKFGKLRIWDTTQEEHLLRNEYQPFVGVVKDIAWSHDNQRIMICGEGKSKFGHVINAETGTSVGDIAGHSKQINSCDFKPSRPFRIITGSEDTLVTIFEGPPFKFKTTIGDHEKYVQVVRYSPSGDTFATAGFDGKMFLYDSKSYEKLGQFGDPAHNGGIYGLSWSTDGTKILTCSGDKTCRTWDVATYEKITQFPMGTTIEDQQVGCLWQGPHMISISLSGYIKYLDPENPEKPLRVIKGHSMPITSMMTSKDKNTLYTGGHDGRIVFWDLATGENDLVQGRCHTNQVQDMVIHEDLLYTCGMDDCVRIIDTTTNSFKTEEIHLTSQPHGVTTNNDGLVIVACIKEIVIYQDGKKASSLPIEYEATCISYNSDNGDLAVGGQMDSSVHVYTLNGTELTEKKVMVQKGQLTAIEYSPDGKLLAASDSSRRVVLYDASSLELAHTDDWCHHSAKVACISWSPDSRFVASGSLDTNIIIWDSTSSADKLMMKQAHKMSQINQVRWQSDSTLISAGLDANIKLWDIEFK